jgi:hypothetical protein
LEVLDSLQKEHVYTTLLDKIQIKKMSGGNFKLDEIPQ